MEVRREGVELLPLSTGHRSPFCRQASVGGNRTSILNQPSTPSRQPQAMMKYYNDPKFLAKLGSKISDVVPTPSAAAAAAAAGAGPAAAAMPEINTLLDAAKYGDLEAVEDFIAIGKDVQVCGAGSGERSWQRSEVSSKERRT